MNWSEANFQIYMLFTYRGINASSHVLFAPKESHGLIQILVVTNFRLTSMDVVIRFCLFDYTTLIWYERCFLLHLCYEYLYFSFEIPVFFVHPFRNFKWASRVRQASWVVGIEYSWFNNEIILKTFFPLSTINWLRKLTIDKHKNTILEKTNAKL